MCRILGVSTSGYYDWLNRPENEDWQERQAAREELKQQVSRSFHENGGVYGSPRILKDLLDLGYDVSESHVADLMREMGLTAKFEKKSVKTTDSNHEHPVYPNLLDRQFNFDELNKAWVTDFTYIWTLQGWLYLASVMDLCSRRIIGYSIGVTTEAGLVLSALRKALITRQPEEGFIHHSDQGSQYCSKDYIDQLIEAKAKISMSRKGDPYDNAVIESFHATIKKELIYRWGRITRDEAVQEITRYIDGFYNTRRRHSKLDYISPIEFERKKLIEIEGALIS